MHCYCIRADHDCSKCGISNYAISIPSIWIDPKDQPDCDYKVYYPGDWNKAETLTNIGEDTMSEEIRLVWQKIHENSDTEVASYVDNTFIIYSIECDGLQYYLKICEDGHTYTIGPMPKEAARDAALVIAKLLYGED